MTRFRRRTFDYEAVQYTGANLPEIIEFYGRGSTFGVEVRVLEEGRIRLKPPGGGFGFHDICPGSWVVQRLGDGLRVVPDEVFHREFEPENGELRSAMRAAREREAMARRIEHYVNGPSRGEKL